MFGHLVKIDSPIPWSMNRREKFTINGSFKRDIKSQIMLVSPTFKINIINANPNSPLSTTIKAGTQISVDISFTEPGTHLVEINAVSG